MIKIINAFHFSTLLGHPHKFLLSITVHPNQKRTHLDVNNNTVHVHVRSKPENGKANQEVLDYLCDELDISRSCIRMVKGHASRKKEVEIREHPDSFFDLEQLLR